MADPPRSLLASASCLNTATLNEKTGHDVTTAKNEDVSGKTQGDCWTKSQATLTPTVLRGTQIRVEET